MRYLRRCRNEPPQSGSCKAVPDLNLGLVQERRHSARSAPLRAGDQARRVKVWPSSPCIAHCCPLWCKETLWHENSVGDELTLALLQAPGDMAIGSGTILKLPASRFEVSRAFSSCVTDSWHLLLKRNSELVPLSIFPCSSQAKSLHIKMLQRMLYVVEQSC